MHVALSGSDTSFFSSRAVEKQSKVAYVFGPRRTETTSGGARFTHSLETNTMNKKCAYRTKLTMRVIGEGPAACLNELTAGRTTAGFGRSLWSRSRSIAMKLEK